jgi:hypothetical protein
LIWVVRSPCNPGSIVLDEVLDEDTPGNGPLLKRYDAATNFFGCDFGLVDRADGRGVASGAALGDTKTSNLGNHLMLVGLIFQIISRILFVIACGIGQPASINAFKPRLHLQNTPNPSPGPLKKSFYQDNEILI